MGDGAVLVDANWRMNALIHIHSGGLRENTIPWSIRFVKRRRSAGIQPL
ncbi:hypothetical protein SynA1528_00892 [Synechococcus sp. A15-28]|nr:hypothetical protein SynA1528_00892 [Synechococcus sp. A15-28]